MEYTYDRRYYRITKRIKADSSLSVTDRKYLAACLRQMTGRTSQQVKAGIEVQRRRHELRELAHRIMFKGERYADRPLDTLPVWTDPDD